MKLQDFPDGKMLKINRRNNSRHYRVYQKDKTVRFELELKHRQTKLIQDYWFTFFRESQYFNNKSRRY